MTIFPFFVLFKRESPLTSLFSSRITVSYCSTSVYGLPITCNSLTIWVIIQLPENRLGSGTMGGTLGEGRNRILRIVAPYLSFACSVARCSSWIGLPNLKEGQTTYCWYQVTSCTKISGSNSSFFCCYLRNNCIIYATMILWGRDLLE